MRRRREPSILAAGTLVLAIVIGSSAACDRSLDLGRSGNDAASALESGAASDGPGSGDGPAAPITCDEVCKKVQACGLLEPGKFDACLADCRRATQADLSCVMAAACGAIMDCARPPDASSDGPTPFELFEIEQCKQACDHVEFFDCIDASTHAACRSACETVPATKRNSFEACGSTGSDCPKLQDCVRVLLGD